MDVCESYLSLSGSVGELHGVRRGCGITMHCVCRFWVRVRVWARVKVVVRAKVNASALLQAKVHYVGFPV